MARFRGGQQHVDITWELPSGTAHGSGQARGKKAARRNAARKLLQALPVGPEAQQQMRKQMLSGLRHKLGAQVVEDGMAQQVYRVVWKVPRPQNRAPLELSAEGEGPEAQVRHKNKHGGAWLA